MKKINAEKVILSPYNTSCQVVHALPIPVPIVRAQVSVARVIIDSNTHSDG